MLALAAGIVAVSGHFTQLTAVIFGFACMPLIFAGMIIVLPLSLTNERNAETTKKQEPSRKILKSVIMQQVKAGGR